jgi:ribosomal protein S18 acetylase RimI-like enzyme
MGPRYSIRPAQRDELDALYDIHRVAMETYVSQTWGSWDDALQRNFFADQWPDLRLAIDVDGVLGGFLDLDESPERIRVENLELAPAHQGRGIGTAILVSVQQRAALHNQPVGLQVLKVNPARRLYERLGFQQTGETKTHYQMAWESTP